MEKLADGSWLTNERIRAVATLSGTATLCVILFLLLTSSGTLDYSGRPLGTDFSNVWTAGRMALEGRAAEAWNWAAHYEVQQAAHGNDEVPFYGWHYPPPFLLLAASLALTPYLWALLMWQAASLAAVAALVCRIVPSRETLLLALSAPVVLVCLIHGHNGFLTAALLGGGLFLLERRPLAAGILLGCLIYKPQFGLLIPPVLVVGKHTRALLGATGSAATLVALTLLFWGWPVWHAFIDSLPLTRQIVIEAGSTGWGKIQSPFSMIRMWGGGIAPAYAIQTAATIGSISAVLYLSRTAPTNVRNASAMAAALLSTPYVLDYDFAVLGVGCAFLLAESRSRGCLRYEKSAIALIWAAPLFARSAATFLLIPLGQMTALVLLVLAIRRGAEMKERKADQSIAIPPLT